MNDENLSSEVRDPELTLEEEAAPGEAPGALPDGNKKDPLDPDPNKYVKPHEE